LVAYCKAIEAYDVECIDALIGDISPPGELMKTQTDRKIADELQRTYDAQREAQIRRQMLERETAAANMQAEVVRSEQQVRIQQMVADEQRPVDPGELLVTGDQWPIFLYAGYTYDPEDPWNGLLQSNILVSVSLFSLPF